MRAAAKAERVVGWAAINPPLDYGWALFLGHSGHYEAARTADAPRLLLHATEDDFCSRASFEAFAAEVPEPRHVAIARGCRHFDVRRELPAALDAFIMLVDKRRWGVGADEPDAPSPPAKAVT